MEERRWTDGTLRAVSIARNEARRAGDSQVCTEHLLLGVLGTQDDPQVRRLLEHFQISPERLRRDVEEQIGRGDAPTAAVADGPLLLAPRAQRVLDLAQDEADEASVSGGTNAVLRPTPLRPAHVLLGLIREEEGLAGRVLAHRGARHTEQARALLDAD
jgi:ATP-dependent Clp protease ATP-binding subunit ClpC